MKIEDNYLMLLELKFPEIHKNILETFIKVYFSFFTNNTYEILCEYIQANIDYKTF